MAGGRGAGLEEVGVGRVREGGCTQAGDTSGRVFVGGKRGKGGVWLVRQTHNKPQTTNAAAAL